MEEKEIKWHGHRGCRGLLPENSLPAFFRAIELGMDYLEMDVVISKDKKVVVAHEPYMPSNICRYPDGSLIPEELEKDLNIFQMDYGLVRQFDCGQKHPKFPLQEPEPVHRPTLEELFAEVELFCRIKDYPSIGYTIELKSHPDYDNIYHPEPREFVNSVLEVINQFGLEERCILQSFDKRILQEIKKQEPEMRVAYLVQEAFDLEQEIERLGFLPEFLGPAYQLVNRDLVEACHARSLQVVPWTVNESDDMRKLIALGVDGIITDHPERKMEIVE